MSVLGPISRSVLGSVFPARGFSPRALFAAGEVGAWYDPSDLTTLFQDTAGTTPVTTPGQRVALMLDKSRGLALGPELVTNGTFDANITGWTLANVNSVVTWDADDGGSALVDITGSGGGIADNQTITVVAGRTYVVSVRVKLGTYSGTLNLALDASNTVITPTAAYQTFTTYYVAADTDLNIALTRGVAATGTIYVSSISVRELPGNHAAQSVLAQQPTYRIDAGGRPYLEFDGIDDGMLTSTITPGADKAQVFAGVRKLSDAAIQCLYELSAAFNGNQGSLVALPSYDGGAGFGSYWFVASRGSTAGASAPSAAVFPAPSTAIHTQIADISGDQSILRINGAQAAQSTADQGTGNFLAYPLYLGRRGGASLPFNGHLYGAIVRFSSANLGASQIAAAERWMAGKTGVVL